MDRTYYLGKNGLEYPEYDDAVRYGGGVVGKRTVMADRYEKMPVYENVGPTVELNHAPAEAAILAAPALQVPETVTQARTVDPFQNVTVDSSGDLDQLTDDQLRMLIRSKGEKVSNLMGRVKLLEKAKTLMA